MSAEMPIKDYHRDLVQRLKYAARGELYLGPILTESATAIDALAAKVAEVRALAYNLRDESGLLPTSLLGLLQREVMLNCADRLKAILDAAQTQAPKP